MIVYLGMAPDSKRTPWHVSLREPWTLTWFFMHQGQGECCPAPTWECPTRRWCSTRSGRCRPPRGPSCPPPWCWRGCEAGQSEMKYFYESGKMFSRVSIAWLFAFHSIVNIVFDLQSNIFYVNYRRYIRCKHKTHTYNLQSYTTVGVSFRERENVQTKPI